MPLSQSDLCQSDSAAHYHICCLPLSVTGEQLCTSTSLTKHDSSSPQKHNHYVQQHQQYPDVSSSTATGHHHRSRPYSPTRLAQAPSGGVAAARGDREVQKGVAPDMCVDVRGRDKGRKRGIVSDICWMLRIKTFQVSHSRAGLAVYWLLHCLINGMRVMSCWQWGCGEAWPLQILVPEVNISSAFNCRVA